MTELEPRNGTLIQRGVIVVKPEQRSTDRDKSLANANQERTG